MLYDILKLFKEHYIKPTKVIIGDLIVRGVEYLDDSSLAPKAFMWSTTWRKLGLLSQLFEHFFMGVYFKMFERLISLVGRDNFNKLSSSKIIVIGLGGVGGYVVEGLVRSGIMNMTIVDGDVIEESNLNRQIIALQSTLGKKKADVVKNRIIDINPNVCVEVIPHFLDIHDVENLNLEEFDYIVDCIDDVAVKVELSRYAVSKGLKFVMATGTAKKMHPEKLTITTLDKTSYDPLSKVLRRELKDIARNIPVVFSSEQFDESDSLSLGSNAFVPAAAGILIASYIVNDILSA